MLCSWQKPQSLIKQDIQGEQKFKNLERQTLGAGTEGGIYWTSVNGLKMFSSKQTGTAVYSRRASSYNFVLTHLKIKTYFLATVGNMLHPPY